MGLEATIPINPTLDIGFILEWRRSDARCLYWVVVFLGFLEIWKKFVANIQDHTEMGVGYVELIGGVRIVRNGFSLCGVSV